MSLLSRSPIITASEGAHPARRIGEDCYSNIGTRNVRSYCVKHFVSLIEELLKLVVRRHLVTLAAFFLQPHPPVFAITSFPTARAPNRDGQLSVPFQPIVPTVMSR
jgi:hypothetical protein